MAGAPFSASAAPKDDGFISYRGKKVVFMPQRQGQANNGCPGFRTFPNSGTVPVTEPCGGQSGVIERADDRGLVIISVGDRKLIGQIDKRTEGGVLLIKRPEVVIVSPAGDKTRSTMDAVNLVLAEEIDGVRAAVGTRKLYSVDGKIVTFDPVKGKNEKTKVGRETPLEAIDFAVAWSEYSDTPIRVIVQAPSGEMGFLDINRTRSDKVMAFQPPAAREEVAVSRPVSVWQPPKTPSRRENAPAPKEAPSAKKVKPEPRSEPKPEPKPERKAKKRSKPEPEPVEVAVGPPSTPAELTGDRKLLWELSTLNLVDWAFEINKKEVTVHGTVQNISAKAVDGGGVRVEFFDGAKNKVAQFQVPLDSRLEAGQVTEFELKLPPDPSYERCGIEFNDGTGEILVAFTDYKKIAY